MLKRMHVIDFNMEISDKLRNKGLSISYGDFSSKDVLEHAHHGPVNLVLATIPDSMLQGTSNQEILAACMDVWPAAKYIVTSKAAGHAEKLYEAGAHYVLRSACVCAQRLQPLLHDFLSQSDHGELGDLFSAFKDKDNAGKRTSQRRAIGSSIFV